MSDELTDEQRAAWQEEILKQAADELAKIFEDLQPMTMEEIGYAALKEYFGIERDRAHITGTTFEDGILDIRASYILPTPLQWMRINFMPPPSPLIASTN